MKFIITQYKKSFEYFREIKKIFFLCLTGFIFLSIAMHFVFLMQPEATTQLFDKLSEFIDGLNIPLGGWACFTGIFLNNIKAMFFSIIYGFIPFLFIPIIVLCTNIMSISVVSAYSIISGNSGIYVLLSMILGVVPHGIFEIPAICLAVTLGINLCSKLNKKIIGNEEVVFSYTVKQTFRMFITFILPLTIVAALVETFITPLILVSFI